MKKPLALGLTSLVLITAAARAGDVGIAPAKRSAEFYYEHFSRNISQDYLSGTATGDQEESRYVVRYAQQVLPRLALIASAGTAHSDVAENYAPFIGVGVNFMALRSPAANLDVFASGSYIHEINYESDGSIERDANGNVIADNPAVDQTESYLEMACGLAVSREVKLSAKLGLTPYAGIMASKIAGDEEYALTFHEDGSTQTVTGDLRESGLASFFGGLALSLNNAWSLRLEGRWLNQASFSAGAAYLF